MPTPRCRTTTWGKLEEALGAHSKALEIKLKELGPEHLDIAMSYCNMGAVYRIQGKLEEALGAHSKALEIDRSTPTSQCRITT